MHLVKPPTHTAVQRDLDQMKQSSGQVEREVKRQRLCPAQLSLIRIMEIFQNLMTALLWKNLPVHMGIQFRGEVGAGVVSWAPLVLLGM